MKKILFVCAGNTCRSVMAEALFRHISKEHGLDVEVQSAGVSAYPGDAPTDNTLEALRTYGVDASALRSNRPWPHLVEDSDLVLVMETQQKEKIMASCPQAKDKVFLLKEFAQPGQEIAETEENSNGNVSFDIPDPYGRPLTSYQRTAAIIEEAMVGIINRLRELEVNE